MTAASDAAAVTRRLAAPEPVCVTTHVSPDGDALGSLLGLGLALRASGRDVRLLIAGNDAWPGEYDFLPLGLIDREEPEDLAARTLWALDCGSAARIAIPDGAAERAAALVNVDHHHDNTRFGDLVLVDAEAACTAQIVHALLRAAGLEIPLEAAEALYVGLVTDTGRFQYPNTDPAALRLAADLVAAGVHPARLFSAIWEREPLAKKRLLGLALERARPALGGRLLTTTLSREDFSATGASEPESDGVIDHLRSVVGVEVAAVIRETLRDGAGRRKVSLRARDGGTDVSAIARKRGGGGHRGAAGFESDESAEAIEAFLEAELEPAGT
jgi:phosphoesterase RecJ-like protein